MKWFIRLFFRTLRLILSPILLSIDWLTSPRGIQRSAEAQAEVDAQCRALSLYQFRACPFCIKTRRALKRLSLNIELRDAQHDAEHRATLLKEGGQVQVPCLRIEGDGVEGEVRWLYESEAIIHYLESRFGNG